jgi:iron complex transport system substrate-binding protein
VRGPPIALCLAAALSLAGCEVESKDPPEGARPLKVQHALGETRVPGRSERPVALYPSELDSALALGVRPAGAATHRGLSAFPRYLNARGVPAVGPVDRPDVREIEVIDPDLILIGKQSHQRLYRRLKDIAPTVALDELIKWKPNFRHDGEALGRTDRAEALLTDYDRRAARVRRLLDGRRPRLPEEARRSLRRPFIASILEDLGLPHPRPGSDRVPGARPGAYDHWTLGTGPLAARRVLLDLSRFGATG